MAQQPFVSVIVPTLNAERTLAECLEAVRAQNYPRDRLEIVLADAGSTDRTLDIARQFGVERIVPNELKTGEAGKAAGIHAAHGELLAMVDSDNVLDSPEWMNRMVAPFADAGIVASEPLHYTRREGDAPLTRYFAMLGMSDPLCLFLGNYDRYSGVTGRWTDLPVRTESRDGYLVLTLDLQSLPTIGANGTVLRRSLLNDVNWSPYFNDIDVISDAVEKGHNRVAKVDCGVVHIYCRTLAEFRRKQDRRIRDFLFFKEQKSRSFPWASRRGRVGVFCLSTLTVFPLVWQACRGWSRCRDAAWLYHVPVCWTTLWIYGWAVMGRMLGIRPRMKSRDNWRQ